MLLNLGLRFWGAAGAVRRQRRWRRWEGDLLDLVLAEYCDSGGPFLGCCKRLECCLDGTVRCAPRMAHAMAHGWWASSGHPIAPQEDVGSECKEGMRDRT